MSAATKIQEVGCGFSFVTSGGFLSRIKYAQIFLDTINRYLRDKSGSVISYTFEAGRIVRVNFSVSAILYVRRFSKVFETIVVTPAINMVHLSSRPIIFHDQPSEAMRKVGSAFELNVAISSAVDATGHRSNFDPARRGDFPSENARHRVVIENSLDALRRDVVDGGSHFRKIRFESG